MISRRRFMGQSQDFRFTELEYIEATGTQYIDTEYICSEDTKIEIDFTVSSLDAITALFGVTDTSVGDTSYFYSLIVNKKLQLRFGVIGKTMPTELEIGQRYVLIQGKQTANVNDVELGSWSNTLTPSTKSIFLMAVRNNTIASYQFKGRIYGFKIYESNILAMDLIPAFDNKLRKPCLYDKVNHKFYYNAGTGEFLYKPKNSVELEYLESSGYQCIESGIYLDASSDIKTVVELEIPSFNKNYNMLFGGAMSTSYNLYTCHISQEDDKYYLNFKYGQTYDDYTVRQEINLNQKYTVTISRNYFSVDDIQYENPNSANKFETDKTNINLFTTSTTRIFGSYVRIYSAKIYKDNVLIRDFVPMLNTDGVLCLYDKVESKYYYNTFVGQSGNNSGNNNCPFVKWKYKN